MAIFLLVALVIDALMVWNLAKSWRKRGVDWRHYAWFVGFIAALIAVTATALVLVIGAPQTRPTPTMMGFFFVMGIVAMISILATIQFSVARLAEEFSVSYSSVAEWWLHSHIC